MVAVVDLNEGKVIKIEADEVPHKVNLEVSTIHRETPLNDTIEVPQATTQRKSMVAWYLRASKSIELTQRKSIIEWFHKYRVVSHHTQKVHDED
jgi:hypothetical protein